MENKYQINLVETSSCFGRFGTFVKDCLLYSIRRDSNTYNLPNAIKKLNSFFSIFIQINVKDEGFFIDLYEWNEALGLILLSEDRKEELWKRVLNSDLKISEIF